MKKTMRTLMMGATILGASLTAFAAVPTLYGDTMIESIPAIEVIAEKEQINEMPEIDLPMYHWATETAEKMADMELVEMRLTKDFDEAMDKDEFANALITIFDLTDAEAEGLFAEDGEVTTLTRIQTAAIISQIFEAKDIETPVTRMSPVFADIEEGSAHHQTISFVVNAGIMSGDHEGNFNPTTELTYAEAVTILSRISDIVLPAEPAQLPEL